MLDDRDRAGGPDDDALGGQRAVARVGRVLVQLRHAGEDLMNEAEGRLDVERQQVLLRAGEHARQPDAGNTPRDERDLRAFADVLDVIHAREVLAAHVREAVDPFTDEELERRDRREGVAQDEDLAWPVVGITAVPGAKSVLEDRLPRIVNTRAGCFHTRAYGPIGVPAAETPEFASVDQKRRRPIAKPYADSEFRR